MVVIVSTFCTISPQPCVLMTANQNGQFYAMQFYYIVIKSLQRVIIMNFMAKLLSKSWKLGQNGKNFVQSLGA